MYKILYLLPGPSPLPKDPQKNQFFHLSRYFSGDVLSPIWGAKNANGIKLIEDINSAMGNFKYHVTFSSILPNFLKIIWDICFYIFKGAYFHYFKERYDVIITYGPFKTGLAGYLLKIITRAKLIIEFPGNPRKSFQIDSPKSGIKNKIKNKISNLIVPIIISKASHVKLLYPGQLIGYKNIENVKRSIFHDFSPISILRDSEESDNYILFLGYPWFLKGVDILIKAFKLISNEFPKYRLKIVGFCPDKTYFQKLLDGNSKIELCEPVYYDKAMELMSRCALFVLPSRTEGMGRVLLEAMAYKKPIVASNVDGIPYYIKDGFNGLLFKSENVEELADKIRIILGNLDYAANLAYNGFRYVHEYLSEERFVEFYREMIEQVLSKS